MAQCRYTQKMIHPQRALAEEHLERIQDRDLREGRMIHAGEVYFCQHCTAWHIGRRKKGKRLRSW